jgi:hypothetical protein
MKKILLFLLSCCCMAAMGQNMVNPVIITMPANTPANTAEWATAMPPVIITAQTKLQNGRVDGAVVESKILVTIKQGGSKVCGSYTQQTAPASSFNSASKTWTGASILQLLGQDCILKPGSYELCVQFYGRSTAAANTLLGESCKPFTIADNKQESYTPPTNIFPANKRQFNESEIKAPTTFRWTPIAPKPQQAVTYRLKVWQLMEGQTATAAIKTSQPVIEEEIKNQTQFVYRKGWDGVIKGGSRSLVWSVETLNLQNSKLATSEPTEFYIGGIPPPLARVAGSGNKLELLSPHNGNIFSKTEIEMPIYLTWTPYGKDHSDLKYKIKVWRTGAPESAAKILYSTINSVTVSGLDFNECYPDSRCHYKWQVQALNHFGDIIGGDEGISAENIFTYDGIAGTTKPSGVTETSSSGCATTSVKSYQTGDEIKLSGNFKMKLTETPTGSNDALTGKGTVDVKWIGILNVQFNKIRVTCDDKIDTGTVYTVYDEGQEYPTQWAINVLNNTGIPNWTTAKIKSICAGIKSNAITKPLIAAGNNVSLPAAAPLNMPLGYFQHGDDAFGALGFTEMVFKKDKAEFEVIASLNTTGIFKEPSAFYGTDAIALQGKGIQFTDQGLKKINGEIKLLEPILFTYAASGGGDLKMKFNKDSAGHIGNSIVFRDTSANFWRYNFDVNIDLPNTWLTPVDETKTNVGLNFQAQINKWGDYILQANIPACTIPNTNGLGFDSSVIVYDHSTTANVDDMEFPENYGDQETSELFSGFYIKSFNMTLPDGMRSYADTSRPIRLGTENLIINKSGITGKIFAHNVLSYPIANIGNLGGSIDTVDVELYKKSLTKASMKGQITIPISNGQEENSKLNYTALFIPASASEDTSRSITFTLEPDGDIDTKFLGKGKIKVFETSNLNMEITKKKGEQRKIKLEIDVNGDLYYPGGKIANPVNPSKPLDVELNCKFEHMNLKYDNLATEKLDFDPGNWKFASAQKKLAGFNFTIEDVKPVINSLSLNGQFIFRGGVEFKAKINIGSDNSKFKISGDVTLQVLAGIKSSNHNINSSSDTSGVKKYWGYLTHLKPEFLGVRVSEINVNASLSAVDIKGKVVFFREDAVYGNGFKGDLEAKFKSLNMTISAGAIFGNTKYIPGNTAPEFKYWMVQAQVVIPPPGIVFMSGLAFRGFGVGVYSKMNMTPPTTFNPAVANSTTFGGATFTPNSAVLIGFKVKALIATTPKEETFNGSVALSGEFSSSAGLEFIQFDGTFACGAKIGEESKAFASGMINVRYDFVNKIFDLKSYLNLDTRSKGIDIYTPSPIFTALYVNSKTNKWYFKSGTPTSPMAIKVYGVSTNSYLMFGNDLGSDIPNGFMQLTKDGWAAAGLSPMAFTDNATAQNKYKSAKGFAFGVAVRGGNSDSYSVFSYGGNCCDDNCWRPKNWNSVTRFLNVNYSYVAGGEVDASLLQYNGCTGFGNGWRASVSAALYAGVSVSYSANFPFTDCAEEGGNLCSFRAGAIAQAQFPNPTYFSGHIEGYWSVGGYSQSFAKDITIGTQCNAPEAALDPSINEAAIYQQQNVKDSLKRKLITKITGPASTTDNTRNLKFSALLEYQYNEPFDLQEQQADGSVKVRTFRVLYTASLVQDSSGSLGPGTPAPVTVSSTPVAVSASSAVRGGPGAVASSTVSTPPSPLLIAASPNPTLEDAGYDALGAKQWRLTGSGGILSQVALRQNTTYKFQLTGILQEKNLAGVWVGVKPTGGTAPITETQFYYFKTNSEPVNLPVSATAAPAAILHTF